MPADAAASSLSVLDLQQRNEQLEAELNARTAERDEALEQQTAMAEVLKVISESPTDVQPALDAVAKAARRFCGALDASITLRQGEELLIAAHDGLTGRVVGQRDPFDRTTSRGLSIATASTVHIPDLEAAEGGQFELARRLGRQFNFRAVISTPLMRDGQAIGSLTLRRPDPGSFTPRQIQLLETFSAQAVIAIENVRLFTGQREALAQQTATSEVLEVINASPGELQPVFDAMLERAVQLTDSAFGTMNIYEGGRFRSMAFYNVPDRLRELGTRTPPAPGRQNTLTRIINGEDVVHVEDMAVSPSYREGDPRTRGMVELGGARSLLVVALRKDGALMGSITAYRQEIRPFTDKQVALLQNFAAQAVIAMENARLLNEQRETLERQTATADILQVISQSPGQLKPVFEAILASAARLCRAQFGVASLRVEGGFRKQATINLPPSFTDYLTTHDPLPIVPGSAIEHMDRTAEVVHIADLLGEAGIASQTEQRRTVIEAGARTMFWAPIVTDGRVAGMINLYRTKVDPFTDRQIDLIRNFAAQAAIAIENTRLFNETKEALEQQTATAEVLQVINSSPGDIVPVFESILEKAHALCGVAYGSLQLYNGEKFRAVAVHGLPQALADQLRAGYIPGPTHPVRPLLAGGESVQVPDLSAMGDAASALRSSGLGTALFVALRKEDLLLGQIVAARDEIRPFTDKESSLLRNFAQQAVIAMENARLLTEQREALERQTATAEVLKVINASPGHLAPVFDAVLDKAIELCSARFGTLFLRAGQTFGVAANRNVPPAFAEAVRGRVFTAESNAVLRHVLEHKMPLNVADMFDESYQMRDPLRIAGIELGGVQSLAAVPMVKDGDVLGAIVIYREEPGGLADAQIALVGAFADQAVIAMENARLLGELRNRTDDLTQSLEYQTATSSLLEVISRSTSDIQPVLDTMLASAAQLCATNFGTVAVREGDVFRRVAILGYAPDVEQILRAQPVRPGRGSVTDRVLLEKGVVQVTDLAADPEFAIPELRFDDLRTTLGVPLLRDGEPVGAIVVTRNRIEPFSSRQIELLKTFADQAVIAMENARLLSEVRRREQELSVTFDHMGDGVLMLDADLRLAAWNRNFQRLLDVPDGFLAAHPVLDDYIRLLVERGEVGEGNVETEIARYRSRARTPWSTERTRAGGRVIEVRSNPIPSGGSVVIYSDITERKRAEAEIASARDAAEAALERQTATAEILKVIASSPDDVQPVFDVVVKATVRLCGAQDSLVVMGDGPEVVFVAHEGSVGGERGARWPLDRENVMGRAIIEGQTIHIPDASALGPGEFTRTQQGVALYGFKAIVAAPLMREGRAIGALLLRKREPGAFSPQQVELLETFAAQAVIAIENVRLFTELRESLEQQTATGEILRVIAQSPTDVKPVLDAVAAAALRFCGANDVQVCLREAEKWFVAVHLGPLGSKVGERRILDRQTGPGRAITDGKTVHLADVRGLDPVEFAEARKLGTALGFNSALCAPMMRDEVAIGGISLRRPQTGSFSERQIALLESFAAQAVIAIENVRLFSELREALEQQTATADILRVISQSPTDVSPVLAAVAKAALKFCDAADAVVFLRDGDSWFSVAHEGPIQATPAVPRRLNRLTAPGRAMLDGSVVQIGDVQSAEGDEFPEARELGARLGFRSALAAPLMRDGSAIGAISLRRSEPARFTSNQVQLLESFAAQAVIAIENVRLFTELRDSLERLKAAQANLIQAEKMASLGQLTAGIAHEIKNPLNFVNNFAALSNELLDELKQAVDPLLGKDDDMRAEIQETMVLLNSNLAKILEHGRRADGIVKSMLAHSRGGTGDWQTSNINGLVEEALNLAYHGARAQDQGFNVTLERDFDPALTPLDVVPQDVTRVFLNVLGNGFYATRKRQRDNGEEGYQPTLMVSTRDLGEAVEVRVRDNGIGIGPELRDKLFQPFFTTKPTGEGTGLGLSISYDIVTQQHGGSIEVESEVGRFTEFTVRLPRARRATSGDRR